MAKKLTPDQRRFLDAVWTIEALKESIAKTWRIKRGDTILDPYRNRFFVVDTIEVVFYSDGKPRFQAEGQILKADGKPGKRAGAFRETIEDGWFEQEDDDG